MKELDKKLTQDEAFLTLINKMREKIHLMEKIDSFKVIPIYFMNKIDRHIQEYNLNHDKYISRREYLKLKKLQEEIDSSLRIGNKMYGKRKFLFKKDNSKNFIMYCDEIHILH